VVLSIALVTLALAPVGTAQAKNGKGGGGTKEEPSGPLLHEDVVPLLVEVDLEVLSTNCTNTGSEIEIDGNVTIGGMKMDLKFQNNLKGTKTAPLEEQTDTFEIDLAEKKVIPKQPLKFIDPDSGEGGGAGGNPWISIDIKDNGKSVLDKPIVVGRCVQGAKGWVKKSFYSPANAEGLLAALECGSKGSKVNVNAKKKTGALDGDVYFDNNINKVVHRAQAKGKASFTIAPGVEKRKGWGAGGFGGNPLISFAFKDDNGNHGTWTTPRRCKSLIG
jgi:hypothetical protein